MQPFDGMVDPDPSFEQMRRLPCLKEICELIGECWSASIDCRHTALRVKRKIKDTILKHNGLGGIHTSGSSKHDCSAKALSV
uniref:Serine-threonine/tyrosine-protein kinase catalytic domain-containing protein n=1 Tax=Loa loa TaxID=7209 RepID=A0A1I7VJM5_LOALO